VTGVTFWFEPVPPEAELERRLAELDRRKHAAHRPGEPRRYCPLCPTAAGVAR
jgi:sugar-specific transcriptional regulator TrmB